MSRLRSRTFLWLALSILLTSVFVATPNYLPGAMAAAYAGPEPTPTNLTVFLHNDSVSQPITGGVASPTVATTVNDTANSWSGTGQMVTGLHNLNAPSFYLFPRLAGTLYLNGTPTANIFINQTGAVTTGTWTFYLYAVGSSGSSLS